MRWTQDNPTEVDPLPVTEEVTVRSEQDRSAVNPYVVKLNLLWDERRFIVKMVLWGMICAAALSLSLTKRYEATAHLMPPDSAVDALATLTSAVDKAGLSGVAGIFGLHTSADLLVGILTSSTLQDRLIARYDLKKVYGASYSEDVRARLSDHTAIGLDRKSGIITITVTDTDPKLAAALANSYIEELNTLVSQLATSSARREREFLEERLKQVSQDLEQAEKDLSQFSSKNATLNPQDQGRAMVQAAAELEGRLIAAQAQLEGIRSIYTDNSVRVRALRAEIAQLQHEIERMGGRPGTASASDANQLYPSIRQLPLLGVAWTDLYRKAKIQEAVFEALTKQYELAKVQEAKEIPSVKILDEAGMPQKKSFPPRTLITIIGGFFSFCFAVVWVLGSARWQATAPENPWKMFIQRVWNTLAAPIRKRIVPRLSWRRAGKIAFRRSGAAEKHNSDGNL